MKIDREKLLRVVFEENLWKKLSPEEIRLYLLFIICVDERRGKGKLDWQEIERCLGIDIKKEELKRASFTLEKFHLARIEYLPEKLEVKFELFKF